MDYTRDVNQSQGPNRKDYDALVSMYGTVPADTPVLPGNDGDGVRTIDCGCLTTCTPDFLDMTYVVYNSCRTLLERYV